MKRNIQITLFVIVISHLLLSILYIAIDIRQKDKVVYIRISDVYNDFKMKKDYEVLYAKTENLRQQIVDSLNLEFNKLRRGGASQGILQDSYEHLVNTKKEFDESNGLLKDQYNKEIFTQINQYVSDYSKAHSYDLVLGADGQGSIMASNAKLDITEEIIKYINNKYEGVVRGSN